MKKALKIIVLTPVILFLILFVTAMVTTALDDEPKEPTAADSAQANEPRQLGAWVETYGSSGNVLTTYGIHFDGKGYFLSRRNSDGSSGEYKLNKRGDRYLVENNRFGEYYVIKANTLEVFDSQGLIKTLDEE